MLYFSLCRPMAGGTGGWPGLMLFAAEEAKVLRTGGAAVSSLDTNHSIFQSIVIAPDF